MAVFSNVLNQFPSKPVMEGAGVRVRRSLGGGELRTYDPYLLLDEFDSIHPSDYMAGFPWHPHRGMETVTYMLSGEVEHADSLGNKGVISSGGVQWMTAGSGIIHQEMPRKWQGRMRGFQLWVNLPARLKMKNPKYRGVEAGDMQSVDLGNGVTANVIAGKLEGTTGPIHDLSTAASYVHFRIPSKTDFEIPLEKSHSAFAYVFDGAGDFGGARVAAGSMATLSNGDLLSVKSTNPKDSLEFLLIAGKPIGEPVAWGGPIVMNTQAELEAAFAELDEGTFLKSKPKFAGGNP